MENNLENKTDNLLSATQAAETLNITVSTLWRWRKMGCPAHAFDDVGIRVVYMFNLDEVRAWFKERRAASAKGKELD